MYGRILVAVDGSATSKLGLRHAIALAKGLKARLRVLNVLDVRLMVPALGGYSEAGVEALVADAGKTGRDAIDHAAAAASKSGVKHETALVQGRGRLVSDVIVEDAKKWRADLIVMGTHGRRGFNRLLMGSDSERVLASAPVPVLLVRRERTPTRRAASKR